MPEAQLMPSEWEPDISTEIVGLSQFDSDALSHVVTGLNSNTSERISLVTCQSITDKPSALKNRLHGS
jgi:hypothetical protein